MLAAMPMRRRLTVLAMIPLLSFAATPTACGPALVVRPPSSSRPDAGSAAVARAPSALAVREPIPEITALVRDVDGARMKADVARLAAFGTRHTLSDTTSETRGIGAARRWIEAQMRIAAGDTAEVVAESHTVHADGKRIPRDVEVVDIVTTLPGSAPEARGRRYYVVAHYDSRCTDVMNATGDAPGANDDGSGVAVLLELARVLGKRRFRSTLVLLAVPGEEQGLFGAKEHVATLAGVDVRGVLNNDIVGDPAGGDPRVLRVFSKGDDDSPARELERFVGETATRERLELTPMLVLRADRVLRGGDHLAFAEGGFPAIRFTASGEDYSRQHQDVRIEGDIHYGDTADHVDAGYIAAVARINAAVVAHLANAPESPPDTRLVAELSNDTLLRWSASRDPDVRGYEVVWRATTSATWEHDLDVGLATEARLPMSKDDSFFGVRAYDSRGFRSPVAFAHPVAPKGP
jgi:hypothetical protein